jgi:hypothetical protein
MQNIFGRKRNNFFFFFVTIFCEEKSLCYLRIQIVVCFEIIDGVVCCFLQTKPSGDIIQFYISKSSSISCIISEPSFSVCHSSDTKLKMLNTG